MSKNTVENIKTDLSFGHFYLVWLRGKLNNHEFGLQTHNGNTI